MRASCRRRAGIQALATLSALLPWAGTAGSVSAQSRVVEDVVVEQSRIIERFSPPPIRGSASLAVPPLAEEIPPELAARRTLVLRRVLIEGATHMAPAALEPSWAGLLGREIPVTALFELADRIERLYREQAGILVVATVPAQDLADGAVRIVVFDQSYLRSVEIDTASPRLRERLRPHVDRLVAMQPLRIREIERILLLMSDLAGMNIEASLRRPAAPGNGGSLMLGIAFQRRVIQAGLDNRGSDEVGPVQAFATYQENDLLGGFESTTLTGVTIPHQPRELLFGQVAQDLPVGRDGLHVGYRIDAASSEPGGEQKDLDIEVTSYTAEIYAAYPVLRTIEHSVWLRAGLIARNTDVDVGGDALARDRYRWITAGVEGEHDTPFGPLALQAAFLQGGDVLDATSTGSGQASRPAAEPDFQTMTAGAELTVDLSERVSAVAAAAAQHGLGPLPAEVRMTFGGEPFGRAFDSAAASGDSGVAGAVEVALRTGAAIDVVRTSSAYVFADYGALWFRGDDQAGKPTTLGSAGAGFRATLEGGIAVDLSLAVPFEAESEIEKPGTRLFLAVRKRF